VFLKLFGMNEECVGRRKVGKGQPAPTTRCTALVPMSVTPLYAAIIRATAVALYCLPSAVTWACRLQGDTITLACRRLRRCKYGQPSRRARTGDFSFHSRRSEQFVSISVADLFVSRRSAGRPGLDFASVGQASDSGSGWTWRTNRPVDSADHSCWDHSVCHPVSLMVGNI
jgi:hypothetical protein